MRWDAMLGEDMEDKELHQVTGGDGVMVGINRQLFGQLVNDNQDGGITEDRGSFSMKSMEIEFHGFLGTGSCFSSP